MSRMVNLDMGLSEIQRDNRGVNIMIEKYFKAGIRFTWTKPQDVPVAVPQVGEFVDSARAATPMIYMGLEPGKDGKLIGPYLRLYDVNTLGLRMRMPIQYAWLDYAHARTSRLP